MKLTSASAVLFAGLACSYSALAAHKISPDAARVDAHSMVKVIIQWKTSSTPNNAGIAALGGRLVTSFKAINGGVYVIPANALATLEADPSITYVSLDRPIHHKLDITAATINAPAAWNAGWDGTGIGVAVIDSGVNADPNLNASSGPGSRVVYQQNFTGGIDAGDHYGHGQHVAGIIASNASTESTPNAPANPAAAPAAPAAPAGPGALVTAAIAPADPLAPPPAPAASPAGPPSGYTRLFKGAAPGANIINLRVLDSNGQGTDSEVIAAIDTAIALKKTYNIRVINLSLGRPIYESYTQDPLCQAAEAAWRAGIVVVVAAGNDGRDNTYNNQGYGTITAPANDPYVIAVGAMKAEGTPTRADDLIASYSAKGPTAIDHVVKPDIVAPGNLIVSLQAPGSTLVLQNPGNLVQNSYFEITGPAQSTATSNNFFILSGTSMAAAVVSGAVADLLHASPALTPDQVKILLMQTASKTFPTSSTVTDTTSGLTYTDYYDVFTVGAGYLDLGAAIASIAKVPQTGTAMSPIAVYDPTTTTVTLSYDISSVFTLWGMGASQLIWSPQSVWAPTQVSANKCLWGASGDTASKCLWGAATDTASKCLWGASGVSSSSDSTAESVSVGSEQ